MITFRLLVWIDTRIWGIEWEGELCPYCYDYYGYCLGLGANIVTVTVGVGFFFLIIPLWRVPLFYFALLFSFFFLFFIVMCRCRSLGAPNKVAMLCKNTNNCVESIYTVLPRNYLPHVPSSCCFQMRGIKAFQDS
jgi:hypothetical protein